MTQRGELPPGEFRLSELGEDVPIPTDLTDPRQIHHLYAVLLWQVDRADIPGDLKRNVVQGLIQGWNYYARKQGVDVHVEHDRFDLSTTILEGEDPPRSDHGG